MRLHRASKAVSVIDLILHPPSEQANEGSPSRCRGNAPMTVYIHRDTVKRMKARPLSEPGLHDPSLRIPMAFTACSQRAREAVFPSRLLK